MADLLASLPVSRAEKWACVKRELGYRERVYPRRVSEGKMKADAMERELRTMRAILADYEGGQ